MKGFVDNIEKLTEENDDFRRVLDADAKRWGGIIQKVGIKLD